MTTTRRDALRLMGMALAASALPARPAKGLSATPTRRLFLEDHEVDRIRVTAESPFLKPTFDQWRSVPANEAKATIRKPLETGDLLYHWGTAIEAIYRQAILMLLTSAEKHRTLTMVGLETLHELPNWDYLVDGGTDRLGLMRASKAVTATLLSLEVLEALGHPVTMDLREGMLNDIAEKGCKPCARTIHQMNNPEAAKGWGVDEFHKTIMFPVDMSRFPWILARNNLRAIPTMGLGLGALALEGRDERADAWQAAAADSARRFLALFEPDGSYEEGISYVDFAFRTLFLFLEADYRLNGDVDWIRECNFDGIVNYIVALQNGRTADGEPDIVNISDSRHTVFTCVTSWIANRSGSELAAYAAEHFSRPGYFADFLWYRPGREGSAPGDSLKNVRLDLDWIIARTGWDEGDTVVSFRSGGPSNHEHADRNSFMIKSNGERLLTEHFGAAYDTRQPTWLLRLPVAHNSVLVDGKGHQYHHGEEGTNASNAAARIVEYRDLGDVVYWSSDATPAYRLVNDNITLVRRSVIFKKPDVVVLFDEVEADEPVTARILFHPDNRDAMAELELFTGGEFAIQRPSARLRGRCYGKIPLSVGRNKLDLPADLGEYPYIEASTHPASAVQVLTTLQMGENDILEVATADSGWSLRHNRRDFATITVGLGTPLIEIAETD